MEKPNKNRETIWRLLDLGRTVSQISKITGLSANTVYGYKREWPGQKNKEKGYHAAPNKFRRDWNIAVNRIRRYLGKEEFPLPEEGK